MVMGRKKEKTLQLLGYPHWGHSWTAPCQKRNRVQSSWGRMLLRGGRLRACFSFCLPPWLVPKELRFLLLFPCELWISSGFLGSFSRKLASGVRRWSVFKKGSFLKYCCSLDFHRKAKQNPPSVMSFAQFSFTCFYIFQIMFRYYDKDSIAFFICLMSAITSLSSPSHLSTYSPR